jgi:chemotaxis methyl-accepting protein methylase
MDDQQFRRLLDFLGLSWKGYRRVRKSVKRRLARHLQDRGFRGMEPFLSALGTDWRHRAEVEKLLSVSISRFFRDRDLWRAIEEFVFPELIEGENQKIRVWSAGCARGEEIYSLRILWEEWARERDQLPELELWATDMNPEILDKARGGVFSSSSLKELGEEWRFRYFRPQKASFWAISDSLKIEVRWKVHNLLTDDPPHKEFQIIFLRNNLLTYYRDELRIPALVKLTEALSPGGFLMIGSHEKLPKDFTEIESTTFHPGIFQKPESVRLS